MHKTIITELLNWFVELYNATWKVIDNMEDGDEKGELVRETHALFHREIHFRIETDFWS